MPRITLIALVLCLVTALAALAVLSTRQQNLAAASTLSGSDTVDRSFSLSDAKGRTVTDRDLMGRPSLLYFGYTFCPDICPTELGWMARLVRALGNDGGRINTVFITVDPERDSAEKIGEFAALFDPRMIALRGEGQALTAVCAAYGVVARKAQVVSGKAGYYLMDHTSTIFVLDAHGRLADTLDSTTPLEVAVLRVRRLLEHP